MRNALGKEDGNQTVQLVSDVRRKKLGRALRVSDLVVEQLRARVSTDENGKEKASLHQAPKEFGGEWLVLTAQQGGC